ncbi:MAG: hypothetical protein AB7F64_03625, partial [Gammaproteobacteria bacterium]
MMLVITLNQNDKKLTINVRFKYHPNPGDIMLKDIINWIRMDLVKKINNHYSLEELELNLIAMEYEDLFTLMKVLTEALREIELHTGKKLKVKLNNPYTNTFLSEYTDLVTQISDPNQSKIRVQLTGRDHSKYLERLLISDSMNTLGIRRVDLVKMDAEYFETTSYNAQYEYNRIDGNHILPALDHLSCQFSTPSSSTPNTSVSLRVIN